MAGCFVLERRLREFGLRRVSTRDTRHMEKRGDVPPSTTKTEPVSSGTGSKLVTISHSIVRSCTNPANPSTNSPMTDKMRTLTLSSKVQDVVLFRMPLDTAESRHGVGHPGREELGFEVVVVVVHCPQLDFYGI